MTMINAGNGIVRFSKIMYDSFYEVLEYLNKLKHLEDFLNEMGIKCRLVLKKLPDRQQGLYFKHENLLPFSEIASSGTLALFDSCRRLIPKGWEPSFIYLDEFDVFYHYEMLEKVIKFIKKRYPKCQSIMTSHNTNLMTNRIMRPDCLFILSRMGTLTALCNATLRELREGHNLKRCISVGSLNNMNK